MVFSSCSAFATTYFRELCHLSSLFGVGSVDCLLLSQTPRGQINKCFAKTITDRNEFYCEFFTKKNPQIYLEESGMAASYDYLFKILLMGDPGSGKTKMVGRFCNSYSEHIRATIAVGRFSF